MTTANRACFSKAPGSSCSAFDQQVYAVHHQRQVLRLDRNTVPGGDQFVVAAGLEGAGPGADRQQGDAVQHVFAARGGDRLDRHKGVRRLSPANLREQAHVRRETRAGGIDHVRRELDEGNPVLGQNIHCGNDAAEGVSSVVQAQSIHAIGIGVDQDPVSSLSRLLQGR
jgi:hypothetical protein